MQSKPAARCQHVITSGVQCGSPALRNLRYCYYHQQGRSQAIEYYSQAPLMAIETDLPLFDDAHSIQLAVRQVAHMLLQKKIEHKTAGLLLYSLQIAASNLKQMKAEKPHPAQIVVDLAQVADTPLEPEPAANDLTVNDQTVNEQTEPSAEALKRSTESSREDKDKDKKNRELSREELLFSPEYLLMLGQHLDEPAGTVEQLLKAKHAAETSHAEPGDDLPPGTIQACATRSRKEKHYIN